MSHPSQPASDSEIRRTRDIKGSANFRIEAAGETLLSRVVSIFEVRPERDIESIELRKSRHE
jgi:hypothetical protein